MRKSIVVKITGLLFLMLFVAIANIATIYFYQIQQKHDIHIVNVAGRQRMLSQRISKLAFSVERGNVGDRRLLSEAIGLYDNSLEALWHGGEAMEKSIPPAPAAIEKLFQENKAIWEPFKKTAELVVMEERDNAIFGEAVDYIYLNNNGLLKISDLITLTFDNLFSQKVLFLRGLLFAMLGMDILFFIIGYLMAVKIVKPLKALSRIAMKVGAGDLTARVQVTGKKDEISALATSFNKMTEDLQKTTVSRDYVDNIIESMIDTLIVVDPDAKIKTINKAISEVLGYREDELIGKPVATIFEEEEEFKGTMLKKLIKSGSIRNYDMIYKAKSGEKIPVSFFGSVMKATDYLHGGPTEGCLTYKDKGEHCKKILGIVGVARDMRQIKALITDLEKSKSDLEEFSKTLEKKVQERTKELARSQLQLMQAEKMEAVGRMASGVAHEVKNPLGIVLQGINYFEEKVPSTQKDKRELLQMMKNSIKRADKIVRALLDFSRSEELKMKPEVANSMIEASLGLVEYKLKIKNIKVLQKLEKNSPKIVADRGKLEQVFVNLFTNAIDAMPEGGKLYIRSYLTRFNKLENAVGNRENDIFKLGEEVVTVEVEDTGIGIDEDIKKKVFDPFFTTKNRAEGTGLGLSVTKSIMDMHNGLINVESEKGKGTKFTIVFKLFRGG